MKILGRVVITRLPVEMETGDGLKTGLVMDTARVEEADEIFKFLQANFLSVPPLRQINFWDQSEESRMASWKQEQVTVRLSQPYSSVVRDRKAGNQIVAVNVAAMERRQDVQSRSHDPSDRSAGWLYRAIGVELHRGVDLFELFGTDKILNLGSAVTSPHYFRMGLGFIMLRWAGMMAYRDGAGAVRSDALSELGAKVDFKLGLRVIKTVDYATFQCSKGTRPMASLVPVMGGTQVAHLMARSLPFDDLPKLTNTIAFNSKV